MKSSENFPLLFKRIGNYLHKVPKATPKELKAAQDAYAKLVGIIYGGRSDWQCDGVLTKHRNF